MTDREREIEIAKRLGYSIGNEWHGVWVWSESWSAVKPLPAYLTDRNASAEIVQWFAKQPDAIKSKFFKVLIANTQKMNTVNYEFWLGLLATPRQICDAACKVWGIE